MYTNVHSSFIHNNKTPKYWESLKEEVMLYFKILKRWRQLPQKHVLKKGEMCKKERVTGKDKLAEFLRNDARMLAHWEEPNPTFAETKTTCKAWDMGELP